MNSFELLLVKDQSTYWEVVGITYSNAMRVMPGYSTLRATLFTIEHCKQALKDGLKITISKALQYPEVQENDLVISEIDELDRHKRMALNEIAARMHQSLITVSIIDLMEYLNNYISLLNAGYFITDSNRETKYFEVIENSQEAEEPEPLKENPTFEQEQEYLEKKQKYDIAQENLNTLEKYLNSYDRLSKIRSITSFLTDNREKIQNAKSIEEIDEIIAIYRSNLKNYEMVDDR